MKNFILLFCLSLLNSVYSIAQSDNLQNQKVNRIKDPEVVLLPADATVSTFTGIGAVLVDFPDILTTVSEFKIKIYLADNERFRVLKNEGPTLSPENRKALNKLDPRDKVWIHEARVKTPGDVSFRKVQDKRIQ